MKVKVFFKSILVIILAFSSFIIQNTISNFIAINNIKPNLFILLLLIILINFSTYYALLFSIFSGIFLDISSDYYLGVFILIFILLLIFADKCKDIFYKNDFRYIFTFLMIFIINSIYEVFSNIIYCIKNNQINIISNFNEYILPTSVYSAVIGLLIFFIIDTVGKLFKRLYNGKKISKSDKK